MKFVQLILKEVIKIVATRRQILKLICTKLDFGDPGSAEELTALPRPARWVFKEDTSKGSEGKGKWWGRGGWGRGWKGKGSVEKGEGRGGPTTSKGRNGRGREKGSEGKVREGREGKVSRKLQR